MKIIASIAGLSALFTLRAFAAGTLTNSDFGAFTKLVGSGGKTTLAFDGTILMTETVGITKDTVIDATGHSVILDGNELVRHFVVTNRVKLTLINVTMANGRVVGRNADTTAAGQPAWGGSIYNSGGNLELIDCVFTNNQVLGGDGSSSSQNGALGSESFYAGSGYGGAVFCDAGEISSTRSVFVGNSVNGGNGAPGGDSLGGAIFVENSTAQFQQSRFLTNASQVGLPVPTDSQGGGRALGGALAQTNSIVIVEQCVFDSNRATVGRNDFHVESSTNDSAYGYGGAIYVQSGSLDCSTTLFKDNTSTGGSGYNRNILPWISGDGRGGAICNVTGELVVQSSAFVGNLAIGGDTGAVFPPAGGDAGGSGYGGAIYNFGSLKVSNTTFTQNAATGGAAGSWQSSVGGSAYGGAIFNSGNLAVLTNVTIASNSVAIGKTDHNSTSQPSQALASSVYSGTGSVTLLNTILACSSSQTNVFGQITDSGHNLCTDTSAAFSSSSSRSPIDPKLAPLAWNGGPTPTLALLPDSPAIDAGDSSIFPTTDQREVARPQGQACDIGAFELQPALLLSRDAAGQLAVVVGAQCILSNSMNSRRLSSWPV